MTPAAVATLRGVAFQYPGQPPLLSRVDLRIEQRDLLGVVGVNGSGKTTLLRLLLGLLEPTAGTVRVLGTTPRRARRRIGYVPQHASIDLAVPASALDVVLLGRLRWSSWGPRFGRGHRRIALAALDRVGALDLAARPLRSLSGGQRQRVLVARALVCDAELLLLDEPTTGLDSCGEQDLIELLCELGERLAVVMVVHDLKTVECRFRRVAAVVKGSLTVRSVASPSRGSPQCSGPSAGSRSAAP